VPDDADVLPPGLFGSMHNAFPHLLLSFSAIFLGLMQAAYDGAPAYLTGRMPGGAPIPHTPNIQSAQCGRPVVGCAGP
jgi:alkylation response protein AidB-like acyl-CoA dehydrogenase